MICSCLINSELVLGEYYKLLCVVWPVKKLTMIVACLIDSDKRFKLVLKVNRSWYLRKSYVVEVLQTCELRVMK